MGYTFTTEAERQKIKTLCDLGITVMEIHKITGRSKYIIARIKDGTYEEHKKADAERKRIRSGNKANNNNNEEILDSVIAKVKQQKDEEERKRQETRERIKAEAERAGVPGYVKQMEDEKKSPFCSENLMLRVADSNDYTNALLNGIIAKLDKLCSALGV